MPITSIATRPRMVLLGLDGLPWSLARDLCSRGLLPNLSTIVDESMPIRAELPELSPVNWTSLYTASGPEEHGVFGFTRLDPDEYTLSLADSTWSARPSIMRLLGNAGRISKVINLPNTYPVESVRGMLVAGFVAPDMNRALFPPILKGPLMDAGYMLEADTSTAAQDPASLIPELHRSLAGRLKALDMFWPDLAWDFFCLVFTETDRLFHFLFHAVCDAAHPLHGDCMHLLMAWDQALGQVLERWQALPEPKELLVTADHGFTLLEQEVDLNVFLQRTGHLRLGPAQGADPEFESSRMLPESTAFALDPGRIYIHHQDRFARGRVAPSQTGEIKAGLRSALEALQHDGCPVLDQVLDGDELYPGARERFPGRVPDLVCVPRNGFDLKARWNREELFSCHGRHGMHSVDNVFFHSSHGRGTPDMRLRDVGRAILDFFSLSPATGAQQGIII